MTTAAPSPLSTALRALGEPRRVQLLEALRGRERCVRDLVDVTGMTQPLVSHHLARLGEAGLVTSRTGQGYTYYALHRAGLDRARRVLDDLLDVDTLPAEALPGGGDACCR